MIYWIAHAIFTIISKLFFPVTVLGRENIPSCGSYILASNHLSNLDPMILGIASGRRLSYVAKKSLFKSKLAKFFLPRFGAFPINRSATDIGALKEALKRLKFKYGLVIFPEGTRKARQTEKTIQPGIGFIASKSGVPVVPAFIRGTGDVMPPGSKTIKRGRVSVCFGVPQVYSGQKDYPQIARLIMADIEGLSAKYFQV